MSLIKLAYNNTKKYSAIKLIKVNKKNALIKSRLTTMKQVVEGRTN